MSSTVVLDVEMSCEGCSGAVKRILGKIEDVGNVDIDMAGQKVTVTAKADKKLDEEYILQKLSTWGLAAGKKVALANS